MKRLSEEKKVKPVLRRNKLKAFILRAWRTSFEEILFKLNLNLIYTKPQGGAIV